MKPVIVLLHGFGFSSQVLKPLYKQLLQDKDYEVMCIDLPGYETSCEAPRETSGARTQHSVRDYKKSNPITLSQTKKNANQKLSEITHTILSQAPEQACYLGWSLGGLIAQYIAIHHPNRIQACINFNSSPCFAAKDDWPGIAPDRLSQFSQLAADNPQVLLRRFAGLQAPLNDREQQRRVKQLIFQDPIPSSNTLLTQLELLATIDLRDSIKHIQCPLHYIFAEHDRIVPIAAADKIKSYLPADSQQIGIIQLPDTHHLWFWPDATQAYNIIQQLFCNPARSSLKTVTI